MATTVNPRQPQQMSPLALERAQEIARKVVLALGGYGLFGVELFVCGDEVIFSEVSPRPHDTGMVTLISQDLRVCPACTCLPRTSCWRDPSVWSCSFCRYSATTDQSECHV